MARVISDSLLCVVEFFDDIADAVEHDEHAAHRDDPVHHAHGDMQAGIQRDHLHPGDNAAAVDHDTACKQDGQCLNEDVDDCFCFAFELIVQSGNVHVVAAAKGVGGGDKHQPDEEIPGQGLAEAAGVIEQIPCHHLPEHQQHHDYDQTDGDPLHHFVDDLFQLFHGFMPPLP